VVQTLGRILQEVEIILDEVLKIKTGLWRVQKGAEKLPGEEKEETPKTRRSWREQGQVKTPPSKLPEKVSSTRGQELEANNTPHASKDAAAKPWIRA
jgi:hypothetical protein